ncbi:hypothetical protein [Trichococcus palustris]|jgi:hypothetical protein|nr:hypothetical protein [Trichococcus palustris]
MALDIVMYMPFVVLIANKKAVPASEDAMIVEPQDDKTITKQQAPSEA